MKREIKFRICDKHNKVFHYTEDIMNKIELINGNPKIDGRIIALPQITLSGQSGVPVDNIPLEKSNYVIQQATGVKNGRGKEIYEGDVISYRGRIGTVEFLSGMFVCLWKDQTEDVLAFIITKDIEIIGVQY